MGQVAQVEADCTHAGLLNRDGLPMEVHHSVTFLVGELGEGVFAGAAGAQALEEPLTLITRCIHGVEQHIEVVSELLGEHGENLLGHGGVQPLPIDQNQLPFRRVGASAALHLLPV